MKTALVAPAFLVCMIYGLDGLHATAKDPFAELLTEKFTRIAICGYAGRTNNLGGEETLEKACEDPRETFVVEIRGQAVEQAEGILKRAIRNSRVVDGERAHVPCIAMVNVTLGSDRNVPLFVMSTGELRSGSARVLPPKEDPFWLRELTSWICKLINV